MIPFLTQHSQRWKTGAYSWHRVPSPNSGRGPAFTHLIEVCEFWSNPGALRMFKYVPARRSSALVVVLHGCAQTAASYDLGAGWSTLADRYGFALVLPQQQISNNPSNGFNWFLPGDTERGEGEARSIRAMIGPAIVWRGIDPRPVV